MVALLACSEAGRRGRSAVRPPIAKIEKEKEMRISGLAAVAVAAALAASMADAQQNPFVGVWRGVTGWGTITVAMGPDMRYSEQLVGGSIMTLQQGYYAINGD